MGLSPDFRSFQSWLATAPRGVEDVLASELGELGAKGIRVRPGLVRFTGPRAFALRAVLDLRCVLRVLEPLGDFACLSADELYAGMRTLPWGDLIAPGQTFAISATGKAPGLDHTQFVALKAKDAIVDLLREARGTRPDVNPKDPDVPIVIHLGDGRAHVSLDLAGGLLSDRGYRVRTVEAPLREALASALLRLAGWDRVRPFHDPACGSGTLAIEAAGLACGVAPNLRRPLACTRWPRTQEHDEGVLASLREEFDERARARLAAGLPEIKATDRSTEAVAATQANVFAAGLEGIVRVGEADARELKALAPPGQFMLNVPYGERLDAGGKKQLKSVYHAIGASLRALSGHRAAVLSASEDFESAFGIRPVKVQTGLWNGALACKLYLYEVK